MTVIVKPPERAQAIGAGASMSPGSQILALTANKASANNITIKTGSVERKRPLEIDWCVHSAHPEVAATNRRCISRHSTSNTRRLQPISC